MRMRNHFVQFVTVEKRLDVPCLRKMHVSTQHTSSPDHHESQEKRMFQDETRSSGSHRSFKSGTASRPQSHYENFGRNIPVCRVCSSNFGPNSCARNISSRRALMNNEAQIIASAISPR